MKRIYAILKDYSIYYRNTVKLAKEITFDLTVVKAFR